MIFLEESNMWIFIVLIVVILTIIGYLAEKGGLLKNKKKNVKKIKPEENPSKLFDQLQKEKIMEQLLKEIKEQQEVKNKGNSSKSDILEDLTDEESKRLYHIEEESQLPEEKNNTVKDADLDMKHDKKIETSEQLAQTINKEDEADVEMQIPDLDEINPEMTEEEDDTWKF